MQRVTLSGILIYNDDAEYELHGENQKIFNLSKFLEKIYYPPGSYYLHIRIMRRSEHLKDKRSKKRYLFSQKGDLYLDKDESGLYSYHIDGVSLESVLFDNTHIPVDIELIFGKDVAVDDYIYEPKALQ